MAIFNSWRLMAEDLLVSTMVSNHRLQQDRRAKYIDLAIFDHFFGRQPPTLAEGPCQNQFGHVNFPSFLDHWFYGINMIISNHFPFLLLKID